LPPRCVPRRKFSAPQSGRPVAGNGSDVNPKFRKEALYENVEPRDFSAVQKMLFGMLWVCMALFVRNAIWGTGIALAGMGSHPVAEYRTLHSKAYPVEPEPETPPIPATLTRIDSTCASVAIWRKAT